ncbi:hypothetical protein TS71_20315 [Mycolicibacterium neoaurum]|uniref:Uncharacterized protein n=1 Tax=Mycolicibacterium neoaurum VKM Ac-1815D TaxID=700508 RepID=V5XIU3_MYCNE|nr:hypothetical protein D174_02650 [Mycolicibacterium neoaurum VKM Ac-1815D]AMO04250.1 hypothetical protein MyAD_02585 [Mycolicibacterium neoaurum]KJQ48695.1 hypothetical protein TS71_20315 [Mycolicibacterium neoaurum]KUM08742.1 hypothetical protein AVZ31_10305 [Mycolicibacterium neoaurum]
MTVVYPTTGTVGMLLAQFWGVPPHPTCKMNLDAPLVEYEKLLLVPLGVNAAQPDWPPPIASTHIPTGRDSAPLE